MKKYLLIILTGSLTITGFSQKRKVDLLVFNAKIYTVDAKFSVASAIAVKDGKIEAVGNSNIISAKYEGKQTINAQGKYVYPGFIDAHSHFVSYAMSLQKVNLLDTKSWDEVVQRVQAFAKEKNIGKGEWITGRGWDQNDWSEKEFPNKEKLDQLFPDNPVLLQRVDGHAAIANQRALDIAGVQAGYTLTGGTVEVKNGELTGILVDNATGLVSSKVPGPSRTKALEALKQGEKNCFVVGLTTVSDCGLDANVITALDSLQKGGVLRMRVFAMLSDAPGNYAFAFKNGKIKTDRLNVQAFKVYADGALGSRGAALLQPYSDKPEWSGFLLSNPEHFDSVAALLYSKNWQMCTHAIGDSGNRTMLKIYGKYLKGKNDRRWRIEHAQVVNKNDFALFGRYSIIPSVQPTHATSDMPWAGDRLGAERVKGAYAYKQLLQENGWLPLGTDFPVEDISPIKTFYAAVFRQDAKGFPAGGYQVENALTREEALKGMTLWAAKAQFEEKEKGSLEKGKWADFVILDCDLLHAKAQEILNTHVLSTYVGGTRVYSR